MARWQQDGTVTDPAVADATAYYDLGGEADRLDEPLGRVEFGRTVEVVGALLPASPAVVADIGGGPGRYSLWLAARGHRVHHRDLMPAHVEHLRSTAGDPPGVDTAVADARRLDLADSSVDAVLLLGPLYHLYARADRLQALAEARRIARPGAPVFVAAISRWAPRLHGLLVNRLYGRHADMAAMVDRMEGDGVMSPLFPGSFCGYAHRPGELRAEIEEAGLAVDDLVSVEGLAFALPDLEQRLADPVDREVVFASARAVQRVPELLGLGPHLLAVARVPPEPPVDRD
ncbi:MAG: class I SAM-dependent methyltransferase [Pseudonocardiales bacterium]|nr:MAG: class I SAM-dependent methyltransferase [Pseudonocardiales bacterium]